MAQKTVVDRLEMPSRIKKYIDDMDKSDEKKVYDDLNDELIRLYPNIETRYRVFSKSRKYIDTYYISGFKKMFAIQKWHDDKIKLENNRHNERKETVADEKTFEQIINQDVDTLSGIALLYYLMAVTGRRKGDILYQPFKIENDELMYIPTKKGDKNEYCVVKSILKLNPQTTLDAIDRVKNELGQKTDLAVRVAINAFIVKHKLPYRAKDLRAIYNTYILNKQGIVNTGERIVATRQNLCHDNVRSSVMYNFVSLRDEEKKEKEKTHKWCEACNTSVRKKGFSKHTRTKKHIENVNDIV